MHITRPQAAHRDGGTFRYAPSHTRPYDMTWTHMQCMTGKWHETHCALSTTMHYFLFCIFHHCKQQRQIVKTILMLTLFTKIYTPGNEYIATFD